MTFLEWARTRKRRQTPAGDLLRDIAVDPRFPSLGTYDDIATYLESQHACDKALKALTAVWKEYERFIGIRKRSSLPKALHLPRPGFVKEAQGQVPLLWVAPAPAPLHDSQITVPAALQQLRRTEAIDES